MGLQLDGLRTNGDLVAPFVDDVKHTMRSAFETCREHPDEVAVAATPFALLIMLTARHRLKIWELAMLANLSTVGGKLALDRYREWKDRPAVMLTSAGPCPHYERSDK